MYQHITNNNEALTDVFFFRISGEQGNLFSGIWGTVFYKWDLGRKQAL